MSLVTTVTPGADVTYDEHKNVIRRYRRLQADEIDRGEEYPVCSGSIGDFSHFGIGVGLYFVQLLLFGSITFIGGIILLPSMVSYYQQRQTSEYSTRTNNILHISGVCAPAVRVNATIGCDHGDIQCPVLYREDCQLPFNAALLDLIFCVFFVGGAIFNRFVVEKAGDKLDEMVQTAQDYSVEVVDPNPDETDPDTWYHYFSQFGTVKYVTVTKKNSSLENLLADFHGVQKRVDSKKSNDIESANELSLAAVNLLQRDSLLGRLHNLEAQLAEAYVKRYEACRVYVTFETEKEKQTALKELEVPGIDAILDRPNKSRSDSQRHAFRGRNILDIVEPAEPNNIIWKNAEVSRRFVRCITVWVGHFIVTYIFPSNNNIAKFTYISPYFMRL
jgi:hypothetical protein